MSVSRCVTVWCDGCGDWTAHIGGATATEARDSARRESNWKRPTDPTTGERIDLCPSCYAEWDPKG